VNCRFKGFHHAIKCESENVVIKLQNSLIESTLKNAIVLINPLMLQIYNSKIKECSLLENTSTVRVCFTGYADPPLSQTANVELRESRIKDCKGRGVEVKDFTRGGVAKKVKIVSCKFKEVFEDAVYVESLQNPEGAIQEGKECLYIESCEFKENKSAVQLFNMNESFRISDVVVYSSRSSGIRINRNPEALTSSINMKHECRCCKKVYELSPRPTKDEKKRFVDAIIENSEICKNQSHGI